MPVALMSSAGLKATLSKLLRPVWLHLAFASVSRSPIGSGHSRADRGVIRTHSGVISTWNRVSQRCIVPRGLRAGIDSTKLETVQGEFVIQLSPYFLAIDEDADSSRAR